MTNLLSLSNLLLLHIISDIDSNVDIICLLLTCKKLYNNRSGLRRSIQFKSIQVIDESNKGDISEQFKATATRFNLLSFKDILENSISDHQVIDHFEQGQQYLQKNNNNNNCPQWIKDRISTLNRVDKSSITTALVSRYDEFAKSLQDLSSSSIETLFINQRFNSIVDLASISQLLPNLQRLAVRSSGLKLGPHPHLTLKSLRLDIGVGKPYPLIDLGLDKFVSLTELSFKSNCVVGIAKGLLPSSLTSLTLRLQEIPPRDTFLSLTLLVKLKIYLEHARIVDKTKEAFINLESLCHLKTLKFRNYIHEKNYYSIEITVPPSIKILSLSSDCVRVPQRCVLPQLEKLVVYQGLLIDERVSLSSCPKIKKLFIYWDKVMPSNFNMIIPETVERLSIEKFICDQDILGQVVLPPSLTHLTINGDYEPVNLPQSVIKLKQMFDKDAISRSAQLGHLKKLVWIPGTNCTNLPFTSPPNLETLNLFGIEGDYIIDHVPPTIKYLSIPLTKSFDDDSIFSITSRIPIPIPSQQPSQQPPQQQLWLPSNTTHLSCLICHDENSDVAFRLDEVINHTNVRYLTITYETTLQFSIHRLDNENKNVLILETNTLQGGIITQRKSIDSQQQQYDPIYLYLEYQKNHNLLLSLH
ncbi:hypothetical protein DFA_02453 [Cavenderia fasciculata]|uniref:F-box domain-containing protein n=1 Tax=Cavenderia fasciculata TaxID=261658 RepID=F4PZH6_CACFS|nr:uncharacterized protein DFA_02453 [Cavenderia fasciculata]EGG19205.1 hypothetical protein DFA_02453 [Cavenderia fasciculata]|eukprot:XP_004366838.1 hypothetical protein DFA_02453 [Cavenderia fasciculata]